MVHDISRPINQILYIYRWKQFKITGKNSIVKKSENNFSTRLTYWRGVIQKKEKINIVK